jgi:hypothetical protein
MRPGSLMRFFLVVAGAAILAGTFSGTAAAEHRDGGNHQENVFPKATYPRGDHLSRGRHGGVAGGHRNHGYVGSVVAVPIIVAPAVVYAPQYPYYVQQPYTDMFRRRCLPITAVDAQSAPHFNVRVCSMTPEPLGRPES